MTPFLHYVFALLFAVELSEEQCATLFFTMDRNRSGSIGYDDFLHFVLALKLLEADYLESPASKKKLFPGKDFVVRHQTRREMWNNAMQRAREDDLRTAWESIFDTIGADDDVKDGADPGTIIRANIEKLFNAFDSDKSGTLDLEEVERGLDSCNVHMSPAALEAFYARLDANRDGSTEYGEFLALIKEELDKRDKRIAADEAKRLRQLARHEERRLQQRAQLERLRLAVSPGAVASGSAEVVAAAEAAAGNQVARLDALKTEAVAAEDYLKAAELKGEILMIKAAAGNLKSAPAAVSAAESSESESDTERGGSRDVGLELSQYRL